MTTLSLLENQFLLLNQDDEQEIIVKKTQVKEFLPFLQANPTGRFELINGVIIAMSNATPLHGTIISNCSRLFGNHLFDRQSPCYFFSEMQCKIDEENCSQPDLLVVCNQSVNGKLLEYPVIVGEVFSSNRKNDMDKLLRYQNCPSIQEILMIEQNAMEITVYKRENGTWATQRYMSKDDVIVLQSIDFALTVADIYHRVQF